MMPDRSLSPGLWVGAERLTQRHRVEINRALAVMDDPLWARAAVAWLQVVAPHTVPGASEDPDGVTAHFILFACPSNYWTRLCVLFDRRQLSDRWAAG